MTSIHTILATDMITISVKCIVGKDILAVTGEYFYSLTKTMGVSIMSISFQMRGMVAQKMDI